MRCAVCLLLWEVDAGDLVTIFQGTAYCRRHLIADEKPPDMVSAEQYVAWVRRQYAEREK